MTVAVVRSAMKTASASAVACPPSTAAPRYPRTDSVPVAATDRGG